MNREGSGGHDLETAAVLWATPGASDMSGSRTLPPGTSSTGVTPDGRKKQVGLPVQAKMWATPDASLARGGLADGSCGVAPVANSDRPDHGLPRAASGDVVNTASVGRREGWPQPVLRRGWLAPTGTGGGAWSDGEWQRGNDGTTRLVKPGIRVLANGIPHRVDQCRGLGNAIVPQCALVIFQAIEAHENRLRLSA